MDAVPTKQLRIATEAMAERVLNALGLKRAEPATAPGTWQPVEVEGEDIAHGQSRLKKNRAIVREGDNKARFHLKMVLDRGVVFEPDMLVVVNVDGQASVVFFDHAWRHGDDFDAFIQRASSEIKKRADKIDIPEIFNP